MVRFKTKEAADRGDGLGSVFGLHHFGFWVENEDETRRRLREAGAEYLFTVDRPDYFEEKYKGPSRNGRYFRTRLGWCRTVIGKRARDILDFSGLTCRCRPMHKPR